MRDVEGSGNTSVIKEPSIFSLTCSEKRPLTNSRYRSASYAFFRIDGMLKNTIHGISLCNDVNKHQNLSILKKFCYPRKLSWQMTNSLTIFAYCLSSKIIHKISRFLLPREKFFSRKIVPVK